MTEWNGKLTKQDCILKDKDVKLKNGDWKTVEQDGNLKEQDWGMMKNGVILTD